MLQVIQYQKTGEMTVRELPAPKCHENGILVRTCFSLISAGTEKISVSNSQSSLLARAKKQPEQVKAVLDILKKEGLVSTLKKVQSKLDSYKTLGYSASGIVIESTCSEFSVGDRVACAGAGYATHSEIISVPKNLAVKLPENVTLEDASYTTLGTIALQGVRQANLKLGENVAVIGLGLLGQITVQLLKASGCRVVGMDINDKLFELAKKFGCSEVYPSKKDYIKSIKDFTRGIGFDAVIITASTESSEPMDIALQLTRKKGKIVVVGAVPMNIPRSPFYEKELELTISCSYGPGRYDAVYEEVGVDYPSAYVRWTENRNMEAFLNLISTGNMDVKTLTTHTFDVNDAVRAYDLITGKISEPFIGIMLQYPERQNAMKRTLPVTEKKQTTGKVKIGFIGAGVFAQSYLLPPLKETDSEMISVSTSTPVNAHSAAKKFGFQFATTDSEELIKNPDVNMIFVATKHDSHGKYVIDSLNAGKPVFVEKPLAISLEELYRIDSLVQEKNGSVMVGFNRRFSKPFVDMADFFSKRHEPMSISYRVNAGKLPINHWVYLPEQGAGRIVGEACHFIDCMVYLTKAFPVKVYAESISSTNSEVFNNDNVAITIKFSDGSIGVLEYFSNGDSSYPKEYCEAFCESNIAVMNNFTSLELVRNGKTTKKTYDGKKGHREEVLLAIDGIKSGRGFPISYKEIFTVTEATFAALESLRTGMPVELS